MLTADQWWVELKRLVRGWVLEVMREEEVYNASAWCFGVVNAVNADGKHVDCFINAAPTVTANVPIAPHVGALVVGDKVLILNRAQMRDLMVISKTLQ